MKLSFIVVFITIIYGLGLAQNNKDMQNNPLICDPNEGVCEVPTIKNDSSESRTIQKSQKAIKVIYYTDPICSSCWGIEPQLRKLKLEYGSTIEIEYRMGGLLPDWSYNSGGISKPSDVAHHWDEVSVHYDMPIDGDVWLEDPLPSSYPPSIAFKAAQIQSPEKAILFLREIREMVFMQKKNITKWEHLKVAAQLAGLNVDQFEQDYNGKAKEQFNDDLKLGKELSVRGFPTLFLTNSSGQKEMVYGTKPYVVFENAILKLHPTAEKQQYDKSWQELFAKYQTLTAKEFSEMSGTPRTETEKVLDELVKQGKLDKFNSKNGALWKMKPFNSK